MKRIISLLLTALMAFSVLTVGAASVSAVGETVPAGTEIYFDNSNTGWENVYFYAWANQFFGDTYKMTPVAGEKNLYKMVLPVATPVGEPFFLFKSAEDWSGKQTTDQAVYVDYNTYTPLVDEKGNVTTVNMTDNKITPGPAILSTPSSKQFIDTLPIKIYEFRAENATYSINGGTPVKFTDVASFTINETTTITVSADGVEPQTYTYTKVENATVTAKVVSGNYTGDIYMYTFGGDRVGDEFVPMRKLEDGTYTATINGSAQVIFTTTNSWTTAKKFIILDFDEPAEDQEPLVSAGETVEFELQAPEVTPTTPTTPVVEA